MVFELELILNLPVDEFKKNYLMYYATITKRIRNYHIVFRLTDLYNSIIDIQFSIEFH